MPAPNTSQKTFWGSFLNGTGKVLKIAAATVAFVFCSLVLYNFVDGLTEGGLADTVKPLWEQGVNAASSAWDTMEGFFSDIVNSAPVQDVANWISTQWQNDWVKAGVATGVIGGGLYLASRHIPKKHIHETLVTHDHVHHELPCPPSRDAGANEYRLLKERLDNLRMQERGYA